MYALSILFLLSLAGNQLCQHKAIESTFSNTQLTIFLFNFPTYSHSPISLSSSKKPKPQRILPSKLCRVSHSTRRLLPRSISGEGNMSCTIATCMEPENWVKILFYFPFPCPPSTGFSFSSQQFSVHIHKLFSWLEKAFLVAFSISITNCVSFAREFPPFPSPSSSTPTLEIQIRRPFLVWQNFPYWARDFPMLWWFCFAFLFGKIFYGSI